jgi:hypothetical protein
MVVDDPDETRGFVVVGPGNVFDRVSVEPRVGTVTEPVPLLRPDGHCVD